jgi:inosine/xanthosine triphosphate pyrophosphatase family protein
MKHSQFYFITSNQKKAQDFTSQGFSTRAFDYEVPEILDNDVEKVVLYKAHDIKPTDIIVEDTSLYVEDAPFMGTEIKHVYDVIKNDDNYNGRKATWKVSLCLKTKGTYLISTGSLDGILQYPICETGYHFDRIFAVKNDNQYKHFELLTTEEKHILGPRFQAISKLVNALDTNDYSKLTVVKASNVLAWSGEYQEENAHVLNDQVLNKNKVKIKF